MMVTEKSLSLGQWLDPRKKEWDYRALYEKPITRSHAVTNAVTSLFTKFFLQNRSEVSLPADVIVIIMGFLPAQAQLQARRVCKAWRSIIDTNKKIQHNIHADLVRRELPKPLVDLFGGIGPLLQLPVFTFTGRDLDFYAGVRCKYNCYSKFYPLPKVNWIRPERMSAPIMRFVDPYGRFGFLFLLKNSETGERTVQVLHEEMPCFSTFSSLSSGWIACGNPKLQHLVAPFEDHYVKPSKISLCCKFLAPLLKGETAIQNFTIDKLSVKRSYELALPSSSSGRPPLS